MIEARIWSDETLADVHGSQGKGVRVQAMFNRIAKRYELANAVISLGMDGWFRRALLKSIEAFGVREGVIVDLCCGPGSFARRLGKAFGGRRVMGIDFAETMLTAGSSLKRNETIDFCCGDAMTLPLRDASVELVTCVYGLRNFEDLDRGLREINRVLRRGGRFAGMDFQWPRSRWIRPVFRFYFSCVAPILGTLVTGSFGSGAYNYLPRSVQAWYDEKQLAAMLKDAGFDSVSSRTIFFGVVIILTGVKR